MLRGNSHAVARSAYATILMRSAESLCVGGQQVGHIPLPPADWLRLCGVEVQRGKAILYKAVEADYSTRGGVVYTPGTSPVAPDWDPASPDECGKGLHFCPTPGQCQQFRITATFVACRVKVSDMAALPAHAVFPDKIRARGCVVLYQCDIEGKRLA